MILNATSTYLILALAILGSAQGKLSLEYFLHTHRLDYHTDLA